MGHLFMGRRQLLCTLGHLSILFVTCQFQFYAAAYSDCTGVRSACQLVCISSVRWIWHDDELRARSALMSSIWRLASGPSSLRVWIFGSRPPRHDESGGMQIFALCDTPPHAMLFPIRVC